MKAHIVTVVVLDLNEVGKESIFYELTEREVQAFHLF